MLILDDLVLFGTSEAAVERFSGQPPLKTTLRKLRLRAFGHICRLQPGNQAIDILASTHPHHGDAQEDAHNSAGPIKISICP